MIINFSAIIEWIFKSFSIGGDTKLLRKLESDGIRFVMIIKRHWIYSVLISWRVLFVALIACVNIYLLMFSQVTLDTATMVIIGLLALNVLWWLVVVIIYIRRFAHIQGNEPYIENIYSAIKKSEDSDIAFTHFFNQTLLLLILLFAITIFILFTTITSAFAGGSVHFSFSMINAFLLMIQFWLFYGYLSAMINQEMDFKVVVPGQILFYNQNGLFWENQTMNAEKIKTTNAKYRWLLGSFINYGDITILSEWDDKWEGEMIMDYVGKPMDTVKEMQKVLDRDLEKIEEEVNVLLSRFSMQIGIDNISTEENKEKMRQYLQNNEAVIQDIFKNGDAETKKEVRSLYIVLGPTGK